MIAVPSTLISLKSSGSAIGLSTGKQLSWVNRQLPSPDLDQDRHLQLVMHNRHLALIRTVIAGM